MKDLILDIILIILFQESLNVRTCTEDLGMTAFDDNSVDFRRFLECIQRVHKVIHHLLGQRVEILG